MDRLHRARHLLPSSVLVFFTCLDVAVGPDQVVLGLVVIAPLVAASLLGRRATAAYAALAFVAATLLGFYDDQYQADAALAQAIRLFGVALGGGLALVACTLRQRSLLEVTRLSAEAAAARSAVQLAETLQRNLLTAPPTVPGLQLAVRYVPAVQHARVGGDWYDAVPGPDGATVLVLGDVAGHDVSAAATMAQVRGLLRGIACSSLSSPADLLSSLDRALRLVQVDTLVTVAVATVRVGPTDGSALLRWSNAGHPPPVLLCADGTVSVLERPVDLLLGVSCAARRAEHQLSLDPGDTVFLYSDGLVERRGTSLDEGTAALAREVAALADVPLEEACDALLAEVAGRLEDDVAVLAVRIGPGEAGVSAWTAGAAPRGRRRSPRSTSAPPARP